MRGWRFKLQKEHKKHLFLYYLSNLGGWAENHRPYDLITRYFWTYNVSEFAIVLSRTILERKTPQLMYNSLLNHLHSETDYKASIQSITQSNYKEINNTELQIKFSSTKTWTYSINFQQKKMLFYFLQSMYFNSKVLFLVNF